MKPIIGITPTHNNDMSDYNLKKNYIEAVIAAGGIPLILPINTVDNIIDNYIELIDGLLLSGGIDPDPRHWGEESRPGMGSIDPLRDEFELSLIKEAVKVDMPVLGICRGFQMLNVAFGGTLIQDMKEDDSKYLKHMQDAPRWYPTHQVELNKDSILKKILNVDNILVNSFHHQACGRLGDGLKATAIAKDNVIEAVESEKHKFIIGLQWHPEGMYKKEKQFLKIFEKFISESRG